MSSPATLRRLVALLLGATVGLTAALLVVLARPAPDEQEPEPLRDDPAVLRAAVEELVSRGAGIWDAHPDAEVGRVLQPGLRGREYAGASIASSSIGMREREIAWEKPDGVVRVVLLGDSFVFGYGIDAADRLGVVLEAELRARAGDRDLEVECLHFGLSSWNLVSECVWLRRQLSALRPDLVVQVAVPNDLDDVNGVRGFGSLGRFTPQHRDRANSRIAVGAPAWDLGVKGTNSLLSGLDHESRSRYAEAAREIEALARAVEAVGGQYLLLSKWTHHQPLVRELLAPALREDRIGWLSDAFTADRSTWISDTDKHWNAEGNRRVAILLYGLIVELELLPRLAPAPWDEARRAVEEIHEKGRTDAEARARLDRKIARKPIARRVDFDSLGDDAARQIHGGFDREGHASPYASLILAREGGRALSLTLVGLDRPELAGARVRVYADEHLLQEIAIDGAEEVARRLPLPDGVLERDHLSVRFESTDHVHLDSTAAHCVAFRLRRVSIDP